MSSETPRSFDAARSAIGEAIRHSSETLVCLDFDGTLAPIVADPADARITPENHAALERLVATPTITTAIISGRALSDVRERVGVETMVAGNHGLELDSDTSVAIHPVARKRKPLVAAVSETLSAVLAPLPGVHVENKGLTATVHTRSASPVVTPIVEQACADVLERLAGDALELSTGKCVLECSPAIPWGKGDALALLYEELPADGFLTYVGDDVTDESAFRVAETAGVGVCVGEKSPTAASVRLETPSAVAAFLEWIASERVEGLDSLGEANVS